MGKLTNSFFLELSLVLICLPPIHAQTATTAPANAKATPTNETLTGQAPDEVMKKLSDLVHAGKYAEAQHLTSGLLTAYPNDERLIKAELLLEKSLAATSANATPGSNQPTGNVTSAQPAPNVNATQFTGMDRVDYNSLIELARQAQQNTDLEQQTTLLKQFMKGSDLFLQKHPTEMLLWQLRAASALSLNDMMAGYEAGQRLLASGAADSNDPNLQQLLSRLNLNGWLDKQKVEDEQKKRADAAEADRLKADRDKYTFPVGHQLFWTIRTGSLTLNENDAVYEGSDGNIRFSKKEIREITVHHPIIGGVKFVLTNGKGYIFYPDNEGTSGPLANYTKVTALVNAVMERWMFVSTEGNTTLKPPAQ